MYKLATQSKILVLSLSQFLELQNFIHIPPTFKIKCGS